MTAPGLTVLLGPLEDTPANRSVVTFLRWAQHRHHLVPSTIALFGGAREADLAALGPVFVVNDDRFRRPSGMLQHAGRHRLAEMARSTELRRRAGRDLGPVWVADLAAATILAWLKPGTTVIAHRLLAAVGDPLPADDALRRLRSAAGCWVSGGAAATAELTALGAPGDSIEDRSDFVVSEHLSARSSEAGRDERRRSARVWLEAELGIPSDAPLVVGRGVTDFWRVSDAFLQVCWAIHLNRPGGGIHFLWIAETSSERMLWPLHHDIDHSGLQSWVHVAGPRFPPAECLVAADVYIRSGRQPLDRFDEAETALVRPPIVRFDDGEPAPSALADITTTVPWLDVHAMRDAVLAEVDRRDETARERAEEPNDWDARVGGDALLSLLVPGGYT